MKVGDKATELKWKIVWTIAKIWEDGDISLVNEAGFRIDVSSECFDHAFKLEGE